MDWLRRNFDPSGRSGRIAYWRFQIAAVLLIAAALAAALFLAQAGLRVVAAAVFLVPMIAALAVSMLVAIRRAHDRGRSAVWVVIFVFGPLVFSGLGYLVTAQGGGGMSLFGLLLNLASLALSLWGLVEFGFLRGTRGANAYGSEPTRP